MPFYILKVDFVVARLIIIIIIIFNISIALLMNDAHMLMKQKW